MADFTDKIYTLELVVTYTTVTVTLPDCRGVTVDAETRVFTVPADSRVLEVDADTRTITVGTVCDGV